MKGMFKRALAGVAAAALAVTGLALGAGAANAATVADSNITLHSDTSFVSGRVFNAYKIGDYSDVRAEGSDVNRVVTNLAVTTDKDWASTDEAVGALVVAIQNASVALETVEGQPAPAYANTQLWKDFQSGEYANNPAGFVASLDTTAAGAKLRAIASALADQVAGKTADANYTTTTGDASKTSVSLTTVPGLYLVTDSMGSPILIGTAVPDPDTESQFIDRFKKSDEVLGTANLKPYDPSEKKEAVSAENTVVDFDRESVSVGETVTYRVTSKITGSVGQSTYNWVVKDVYGKALTFNAITRVTVGGTEVYAQGTEGHEDDPIHYTLDTDTANTTVVTISNVANMDGKQVVVEYTMTVNSNALDNAVAGGLTNTAYVGRDEESMGNGDEVELHTYGFQFTKTNKAGDENLAGAEFTIQNANGQYLKQDADTKAWSIDTDATKDTAQKFTSAETSGVVSFQGLPAGEYTVVETKAPEDYMTPIKMELTVTIGKDGTEITGGNGYLSGDAENGYKVYNAKNVAELPLTGAAGTMLFTVLGLLIAGAGALVYMKSRSVKHMLRG
ncbi:SpaH/EbpB family LPXTG-anchored major pilin [Bifidobacterium pullorum]|uniref:SpaH/EbpB family LPXTG-anchored major pilin n=1 Tax=Bifidobacterium pullorum TaxID=78448 RepID=UPI0005297205|nr:SpaH/EbpB family LPXTG-anchored major pilin [Bifidobacterium pullorum]